jgi:2-dehydropantoate 2-reductase
LAENRLRFLCFGMGAIGTYIGGSLAAAGYDVSFIERKGAQSNFKIDRLTVETPAETKTTHRFKVHFDLSDAFASATYDVALIAVKSFDTANVLESIRPFAKDFPTVLCLQNGVENEERLESVLGQARVIGASIGTAVGRIAPGHIHVEKMRGMGVESGHSISEALIVALNDAGLNARAYPVRADLKWSKMLSNLLGNATSAILDWTPAQVFANKDVYSIEVNQIRETMQVMHRRGIHLVNLPGTPIKLLIQVMMALPEFLSRPIASLAMGKGRGKKMPSFHIDLYLGQKSSEVTYLNGAVVRAASSMGIKTPVNEGLTKVLEDLASGKVDKEEYKNHPEKLFSVFEAAE